MAGPYPDEINTRAREPRNAGQILETAAEGRGAAFACGSVVTIRLDIDREGRLVRKARFSTNGCGYMVAAADLLCDLLSNKGLAELGGLEEHQAEISSRLAPPAGRTDCIAACFAAAKEAFAKYRRRRVAEFAGDSPLVCTCFGVSETDLDAAIRTQGLSSEDDVARAVRAGSGCGSCRFLIREALEAAAAVTNPPDMV